MKSSRQSLLMLGVALLVIAGIMLYIGLSQPRVYNATNKTLSTTEAYIQPTSPRQAMRIIQSRRKVQLPHKQRVQLRNIQSKAHSRLI